MSLDAKQKAVLNGMLSGLVITLVVVLPAALVDLIDPPSDQALKYRLQILSVCLAMPAAMLVFSIARLARHRFYDPVDIDGAGHETKQAKSLQAVLQNTLEQAILAALVYIIYATTAPINRLGAVLACSSVFCDTA